MLTYYKHQKLSNITYFRDDTAASTVVTLTESPPSENSLIFLTMVVEPGITLYEASTVDEGSRDFLLELFFPENHKTHCTYYFVDTTMILFMLLLDMEFITRKVGVGANTNMVSPGLIFVKNCERR